MESWRKLKEANADIAVRKNIVALQLHNTCKIGRELIPDVKIERIHFGSNDKVVILGSGMSKRIEPAADVLRKEGFSVELFNDKCQIKPFIIEGKKYIFNTISDDFASIATKYENNWIPYDKSNSIIINDVKNSLLYKANEQFIEKIIREDYTIIHIGQTAESYFCDMENELIKSLKWIE